MRELKTGLDISKLLIQHKGLLEILNSSKTHHQPDKYQMRSLLTNKESNREPLEVVLNNTKLPPREDCKMMFHSFLGVNQYIKSFLCQS